MTAHHTLPQMATRGGHHCDACGIQVLFGTYYVQRGIRRKLQWCVACDPAPRCPRCGVRCDDPWGCLLCTSFAEAFKGLAWVLSSGWVKPPTEERVAQLFRPAHSYGK